MCDHESRGYKEIGWDELRHCPTGVQQICLDCGMETFDGTIFCRQMGTVSCIKRATRVIDRTPTCDSCKIDIMAFYAPNIPPTQPDDDYDGAEYG